MAIDFNQPPIIFNIPYIYSTAVEELFKFIAIINFVFFWLETFIKINKKIK